MKLAFDIGANIGKTIDVLLNSYDKVVGFEPNPTLMSDLRKKYEGDDRVVLEQVGVYSQIGEKIFFISTTHFLSTFSEEWKSNSRFTNHFNWETEAIVETTTLDNILNKYGVPSFVKIDVEGHEYDVFLGLSKLLSDTVFGFEWAEEQFEITKKTVVLIQNLGYSNFYFTYGDNLININEIYWDVWDNLIIHNNIVETRKDKWGMIYFKK